MKRDVAFQPCASHLTAQWVSVARGKHVQEQDEGAGCVFNVYRTSTRQMVQTEKKESRFALTFRWRIHIQVEVDILFFSVPARKHDVQVSFGAHIHFVFVRQLYMKSIFNISRT